MKSGMHVCVCCEGETDLCVVCVFMCVFVLLRSEKWCACVYVL